MCTQVSRVHCDVWNSHTMDRQKTLEALLMDRDFSINFVAEVRISSTD